MKKFVMFGVVSMLGLSMAVVAADKKAPAQPAKTAEQIAQEQAQAKMMELITKIQAAQSAPAEQLTLIEELLKMPGLDKKTSQWARYNAIRASQQTNNFARLETHALEFLKDMPVEPQTKSLLAEGYANAQNAEKAEKYADEALADIAGMQKPADMSQADWDKGIGEVKNAALFTKGRVQLMKASKLDAKDKAAREPLFKKALDCFAEVLKANPRDEYSNLMTATANFFLGKYDECVAAYARTLAINNGNTTARKDLTNLIEVQERQKAERENKETEQLWAAFNDSMLKATNELREAGKMPQSKKKATKVQDIQNRMKAIEAARPPMQVKNSDQIQAAAKAATDARIQDALAKAKKELGIQ